MSPHTWRVSVADPSQVLLIAQDPSQVLVVGFGPRTEAEERGGMAVRRGKGEGECEVVRREKGKRGH